MDTYSSTLDHYLTTWNLSDPQPLAETATSTVYTVRHDGATVVLKILSAYGFEEQVGGLALKHFDGHGAVRLLRMDDNAHLLEYADGENVAELVRDGQDAAATEIIAGVINALHSRKTPPPEGITRLRPWFKALFVQAEQDREKGLDTVITRAAPIADRVLADPQEPRVLHGDIHHENIRQSPRGWLAFDPKGLYGERAYDLANTLCNPHPRYGVVNADEARILSNARILSEGCGIDLRRVMLFLYLYACLSASWTLQEASNYPLDDIIEIAEIAERHSLRSR